jgi:hypothetical protein
VKTGIDWFVLDHLGFFVHNAVGLRYAIVAYMPFYSGYQNIYFTFFPSAEGACYLAHFAFVGDTLCHGVLGVSGWLCSKRR